MTHHALGISPAGSGGVHKSQGHSPRRGRSAGAGGSYGNSNMLTPPSPYSFLSGSEEVIGLEKEIVMPSETIPNSSGLENGHRGTTATLAGSGSTAAAREAEDERDLFIVEPVNKIYKANRRSSSLSECMMIERMSYRPMGRDRDGLPSYALYLEESQGFRWNCKMQRFNSWFSGVNSPVMRLGEGLYDMMSDEDEDIDEDVRPDEDDTQLYEMVSNN